MYKLLYEINNTLVMLMAAVVSKFNRSNSYVASLFFLETAWRILIEFRIILKFIHVRTLKKN